MDRAAKALAQAIVTRLSEISVRVRVELQDIREPDKGPGKAGGGRVREGRAYPVGEGGPETFVPWTEGSIIPHGERLPVRSSAGGGNVTNIFHIAGSVVTERELIEVVLKGMYQKQRIGGALGLT